MTGNLIGYAMVSTSDQNLDLQSDALSVAGCKRVSWTQRPGHSLIGRS